MGFAIRLNEGRAVAFASGNGVGGGDAGEVPNSDRRALVGRSARLDFCFAGRRGAVSGDAGFHADDLCGVCDAAGAFRRAGAPIEVRSGRPGAALDGTALRWPAGRVRRFRRRRAGRCFWRCCAGSPTWIRPRDRRRDFIRRCGRPGRILRRTRRSRTRCGNWRARRG